MQTDYTVDFVTRPTATQAIKLIRRTAKAEFCLLETRYKNEIKFLPYFGHNRRRLLAINSTKLYDLEIMIYFQQRRGQTRRVNALIPLMNLLPWEGIGWEKRFRSEAGEKQRPETWSALI